MSSASAAGAAAAAPTISVAHTSASRAPRAEVSLIDVMSAYSRMPTPRFMSVRASENSTTTAEIMIP